MAWHTLKAAATDPPAYITCLAERHSPPPPPGTQSGSTLHSTPHHTYCGTGGMIINMKTVCSTRVPHTKQPVQRYCSICCMHACLLARRPQCVTLVASSSTIHAIMLCITEHTKRTQLQCKRALQQHELQGTAKAGALCQRVGRWPSGCAVRQAAPAAVPAPRRQCAPAAVPAHRRQCATWCNVEAL